MKAKTKTSVNSNAVNLLVRPNEDPKAVLAQTYLRPTVQAACTVRAYNKTKDARDEDGPDLMCLVSELGKQVEAVNKGDLRRTEAMLLAQAHSLDAIFGNLVRRATNQEYLLQYETYLRLGLKAQSQCRATLETLAAIKNPTPLAFVRQANIGYNQQVNNETEPSPARESQDTQSKLLEARNGERLDTGTKETTASSDSQLEAVGALNRAADPRR